MRDLPPELLNAPIRFWKCLNPAHDRVTWTGCVASCDTCGLTSAMTREFAEAVRGRERERFAATAGSVEALGRLVRETWVAWAREQPDPKPSWMTGWDELDAGQQEVDQRIGTAVAMAAWAAERERVAGILARFREVFGSFETLLGDGR